MYREPKDISDRVPYISKRNLNFVTSVRERRALMLKKNYPLVINDTRVDTGLLSSD